MAAGRRTMSVRVRLAQLDRSQMAIIHLLTPEYPPAIGGVGDYARQVAQGLAEAGDDVHVWCPGENGRESSGGPGPRSSHVGELQRRGSAPNRRRTERVSVAAPDPRSVGSARVRPARDEPAVLPLAATPRRHRRSHRVDGPRAVSRIRRDVAAEGRRGRASCDDRRVAAGCRSCVDVDTRMAAAAAAVCARPHGALRVAADSERTGCSPLRTR